jgi:hypothetical protein
MSKPSIEWGKPSDKLSGLSPDAFITQNAGSLTDNQLTEYLNARGFKVKLATVTGHRNRTLSIAKSGGLNTHLMKESPFAKYDSPPVINQDRVVVLPDLQLPYQDHEFINHVLSLCQVWNVRHCVLAGDVIENASLTRFDPNWDGDANPEGVPDVLADALIAIMNKMTTGDANKLKSVIEEFGRKTLPNPSGVGEEWGYARKELAKMIPLFDDIVWVLGNHEGRMLRQIQSPMIPDDIRKLFAGDDARIRIAPYYYCEIISNGIKWRVTHPKSSAKGDAKWYASKYLVNTLMAHNHQLLMQKDRSGKYWAVEVGACVDESRLPYVSQRDSKQDMHLLGSAIIRDGRCWLLHEDTPWSELARLA